MPVLRIAYLSSILVVLNFISGYAQTVSAVKQVMNSISEYNKTQTSEKIFIQTDKWNYIKEDTLRFKAYVFDASTLGSAFKSGLMYIEIANEENRIVSRNMVNLISGVGWGNIPLREEKFTEGTYVLRAYTNWMRNFDERYIYTRQFTINSLQEEVWLVNSRFNLSQSNGINNVAADLSFVTNNGHSMVGEELKTKISAGRSTLYRTSAKTGIDGKITFDFNLPDKADIHRLNISLTKKEKANSVTFNLPVIINRDERIDVQFMPEGGRLLYGLVNKVAFKALNEQGLGVDVSGSVYNSKQQKVADLSSAHLGMGNFMLQPDSGETYTARINYGDQALSFKLPQVTLSGLQLSVDNIGNADSVVLTVTATPNVSPASNYYYLIGQARSVVCFGAKVIANNTPRRFAVARAAFPTGVVRFTLLAANNQPLAERLIFINHHDEIKLNIAPSKVFYAMRDSVSLAITAADKDGVPVMGNFSLAVTDNAQVKAEASGSADIKSKLMLADDLKGNVEDAGWYFTAGDTVAKAVLLDNLLLTQGWANYKWNDVFAASKPALVYKPEQEFAVKGKVTNAFKKPITKSQVVLISTNPLVVADTLTNAEGEFSFTGLQPADTASYKLQARNKRGGEFNVGLNVDEFVPPVFDLPQQRLIPWYVNIDTARLGSIRARQLYNQEEAKISGTQLLEVKIKASKSVRDSKSLVGPGEADFTLSEDDMHSAGKTTFLDYMLKNVPGFYFGAKGYAIKGLPVIFIIDGMAAWRYSTQSFSVKKMLEYLDPEDVRGVEVMTTGKNQMAYGSEYNPMQNPFMFVYIEITTYSGNGIFMKKTPGTYVYRPPIFAPQKEFYSPKYIAKKVDGGPLDTRATLYWNPNIVTDSAGQARVSFYTGDKSGAYSINMQGADMNGFVGATQSKITVKNSDQ